MKFAKGPMMRNAAKIKELLARVPRPPEDSIPGGVSDGDLAKLEKRLGFPLPDSVRDWLKVSNGPCVGPGGLFGVRPKRKHLDIESYFKMFPAWKPKGWIPIAGDGCGNYYVIPANQDFGKGFPVVFIDTGESADEPAYIVSSDIEHFLISLLECELGSEGWPFDERVVMRNDPHITRFRGVSLPWE
jgi:cell wall assembly regulator SMI1